MAVWQFDTHLLPRDKIIETFGRIPDLVPLNICESVQWWESAQLPPDFDSLAAKLLPKGRHWSQDYRVWGTDDGDRIDVHEEEGRVSGVLFRIDLRTLKVDFLEHILALARHCYCLLLTSEMRLIPPEIEPLKEEIRHSDALHFVTDPTGFLATRKR